MTKDDTTMQAALVTRYGHPTAVLTLGTTTKPTAGPRQVRVRVRAAMVSIGDHHVVTGTPYLVRLSPYGGFPHPRHRVPGTCFAGVVDDVALDGGVDAGADFAVGDEVFGEAGNGAFGEFVVVDVGSIAKKPSSASFEQAAALAWGQTALKAVRDAGEVRDGQHVVVNGAAGAVGSFVVQTAIAFGARVTAVCSTRSVDLVTSLGADVVVDYTQRDPLMAIAAADVVIDLVGNRPARAWKRVLVDGGTFAACSGSGDDVLGPLPAMLAGVVAFAGSGKRYRPVVQVPSRADLEQLVALFDSGAVKPVLERVVDLDGLAAALEQVGQGRGRGQTVVSRP